MIALYMKCIVCVCVCFFFSHTYCCRYYITLCACVCLVSPLPFNTYTVGGGRVVRWCWVNFQCRGVLLVWITVGQEPTALTVGAGGGCLDIFTLIYPFSPLSPSLWETVRYRLKYCLKGPLNPKQPTNQQTL